MDFFGSPALFGFIYTCQPSKDTSNSLPLSHAVSQDGALSVEAGGMGYLLQDPWHGLACLSGNSKPLTLVLPSTLLRNTKTQYFVTIHNNKSLGYEDFYFHGNIVIIIVL